MFLKRKTKTEHKSLNGYVTFYAAPSAILHVPDATPPDEMIADRHKVNFGDGIAVYPEMTIKVPGFGDVVLSPAEVASIFRTVEHAEKQRTIGHNWNARQLLRSF